LPVVRYRRNRIAAYQGAAGRGHCPGAQTRRIHRAPAGHDQGSAGACEDLEEAKADGPRNRSGARGQGAHRLQLPQQWPMIAQSIRAKHAQRVQAVMDLFRGDAVADVSTRHGIGRSDLYKFRRRALAAINDALADRRRGPHQPHNRIAPDSEARIVALCQRHPTWSSYALQRRCGANAPSPRTIQRIRARHALARFAKREPPSGGAVS
jgi:Homeodomain-like domain